MQDGWAVLRCQQKRESVAERAVAARGVAVYLPWITDNGDSAPPRPLFPGYLFAKVAADSDALLRARSAPGVAYVLPRASEPILLPEAFIEAIRTQERAQAGGKRKPTFHRGDRVVVVSGPFKWAEGLFDRDLTPAGRVRILLELVHGTAAIQLCATELRPAPAHPIRGGMRSGFRNEKSGQLVVKNSPIIRKAGDQDRRAGRLAPRAPRV